MDFPPQPLDATSLPIHEKALHCARRFLVAEVDLLNALIDADRHRIHEKFALPALTPYCVKILGLSHEVAGCFVRVARKCAQVPELKEALEKRRLTLFKAKTIASVISRENHESWISRASRLTKDMLEQEVAAASGKGTKRIKLILTREQYELLSKTRELVSRSLDREASREETIGEIMNYFLKKRDPVSTADRNLNGSGNDRSQERSPTKHLRIPAAVRHAVNRRDRGRCQARLPDGDTCGSTRWVHFHHLVPKCDGGGDSAENITTLCSAHHRQWHRAH